MVSSRRCGQGRDVGAVQPDRAALDPPVAGQQAEHRLRRRRLARARFADQGDDLAGLDAEGDAVDDPLVVVARLVGDRQIVDLEQRRAGHGAVRWIDLLMRSAASTTSTTTMPGAAVSHQARER